MYGGLVELTLGLAVLPFGALAFVLLLTALWGCRNGRNPEDRLVAGGPGLLSLTWGKHRRFCSVCVCLDVPPAFRFSLRRERPYDRLAKRLRLAREPQVSHEPFDSTFYLDAEDPLIPRLLERTEGLRARLATGLARVEERGARLREVACADGRLHVHVTTIGPSASDAETCAREAAIWLDPLVAAMRKVRVEPEEAALRSRRAFEARLAPFIAYPLGLTILAAVMLTAPGALASALDLVPAALVAGAAALLAHVAWAWGRTFPSQRHLRALEWLFLGWPGFAALAFLVLLALRTGKVLPSPPGEEARSFGGRESFVPVAEREGPSAMVRPHRGRSRDRVGNTPFET